MLDAIHARPLGALGRTRLERLHRSRVAVIGLGQLGGALLPHLTMLQVPVVLVDPGRVEAENLGNQMLPAASIGETKVSVRAAQIRELNPSCAVGAHAARVEALGLGVFAEVDLLLSGLDGRAARLRLREISTRLGIPWVDAAVPAEGGRLLGTVSCYDPRREDAPCFACRYDAKKLAAIAREGRPRGCPSWRGIEVPETAPTLALSSFASAVSGLQLTCGLRMLLEEDDLAGHQLQLSFAPEPRLRRVALRRAPGCRFEHGGEALLRPLRTLAVERLDELVEVARRDLGAMPQELRCYGRVFAAGLVCPDCGLEQPCLRLRESIRDEELRCPCGAEAERLPARLVDRIDAPLAERFADLPLRGLGLPDADVVTATSGAARRHYRIRLPGGTR